MASESLSQDEIDLLFKGGGGAAPDPVPQMPGARDPRQDVQVYDFRRPARISKDRKRSLTAIYGLLAKSLESWIAGRVRDQIGLDLQSVEQLTFGEFMLALPSPCASYIMSVNGPAGPHQAVMDFGHEFAYFLVDRLLGGSGRIVSPDRGLTPMERMVVRLVADRIALQLSEAWEDYAKLDVKVTGFESIPEMLQVANREDTVLVANIRVTMDNTSSLLLLCLPFGILERFFTSQSDRRVQVAQGNPEERAVDQRAIERTLRTSKVTVGARLPPFMLNMRTLAAIEPGAILATGLPPESDLEIYVAGQKRFTATPGRVGKRLSVRVLDPVDPEPENLIHPGREGF